MSSHHPGWIEAYLVHYLGLEDANGFQAAGRVMRCMRGGSGACGRLGYWFREKEPRTVSGPYIVVWDGKTPASTNAIEYGMVDPDRPYGIDLGVDERDMRGFFSCGWCGKPQEPHVQRKKPSARPARAAMDDRRREELDTWAEKLEKANPVMAAKVRELIGLIP